MSESLVTASPETRKWLEIIKTNINKENPCIKYFETKHWASFKNPSTNRRFAYLNPLAKEIRVFLKLSIATNAELEPTPSTSRWAETYPSVFKIKSKFDIEKAIELIINSYKSDM